MRRKNKRQWRTVELAIALADHPNGSIADAAYMCRAKEIPFPVAVRVLTNPKKRRRST